MKRLFIATSSTDGTCDVIVRLLGQMGVPVFRWNSDLWAHYDITFGSSGFACADPCGRVIDLEDPHTLLLWRKPFISLMSFDGLQLTKADEEQARNGVSHWLQAVVSFLTVQRRVRLVEPYADRRLPKLFQIHEAHQYFAVPRSHFGTNSSATDFGFEIITKPLGDPTVGNADIFYTSKVSSTDLFRPYPWFLQEALIGGTDVTAVYILGNVRFFECAFKRDSDAIDWRVEINTVAQSPWHELHHQMLDNWEMAVHGYMCHLRLHFGRLDFILLNGTLHFLECNTNGQFGWLDDAEGLGLHSSFIQAVLNPLSAIS